MTSDSTDILNHSADLQEQAAGSKCCDNCQAVLAEGKFCSQCGQRTDIIRLTAKQLFVDGLDQLFDLEAPIVRTFLKLQLYPGVVAREYISGQRKKYVNPVKYLALTIAIFLLVVYWCGFHIEAGVVEPATMEEGIGGVVQSRVLDATKYLSAKAIEWSLVQTLLAIPVLCLFLKLLFMKNDVNLTEISVLCSFAFAQTTLVQMVSVPFATWIHPAFFSVASLIHFVYVPLAMVQLVSGNTMWILFKSTVAMALFMAIVMLIMLVFIIYYVIVGTT